MSALLLEVSAVPGGQGGQLVYMLLGHEPKMNIDLSRRR